MVYNRIKIFFSQLEASCWSETPNRTLLRVSYDVMKNAQHEKKSREGYR